jgi:hypothetical protein
VGVVSTICRHRLILVVHDTDLGFDPLGGVDVDKNLDMSLEAAAESLDPPLALFSR